MKKIFKGCATIFAALFAFSLVASCAGVMTGTVDTSTEKVTKAAPKNDDTGDQQQEEDKAAVEEQAKREAEEQAQREAEEQARLEAEEQAKREAEEQAQREAEEQAQAEAEAANNTESQDFNIQNEENLEDRDYGYSSQIVYVTKSGHAYHSTTNCPTLSRSKNLIEMTIDEARNSGHDPCDVCC